MDFIPGVRIRKVSSQHYPQVKYPKLDLLQLNQWEYPYPLATPPGHFPPAFGLALDLRPISPVSKAKILKIKQS